MGDTQNQQPAGGTPQNVSGAGSPNQAQGGEPAGGTGIMSRKEIEAMIRDEIKRSDQSFKDKRFDQLEKAIADLAANGVSAGEVQNFIQQAIQQRGQQPPVRGSNPTQVVNAEDGTPIEMPPIVAAALDYMEQQGLYIEDDDPELKEIEVEKAAQQPHVFMAQIQAAMQKKRERLAQAGSPARMTSLGGGAGASGGGRAALTAELLNLLKEPSKNRLEIRRVKAELAKYN